MKNYRFCDGLYRTEIEIKRSRFIATAIGEVDSDGAEDFIKSVRGEFPDATHTAYGYISDINGSSARFSDDGEPSGTAGRPILNVIRKKGLVCSAVAVTRYFGGIKLGAGGLTGAYSEAASKVLSTARISRKVECRLLSAKTDYSAYQAVETALRRAGAFIERTDFSDGVEIEIAVSEDDFEKLSGALKEAAAGNITLDERGSGFRVMRNI